MIRQGERLPLARGYKGQRRQLTTRELISYHRERKPPAARKTALASINPILTIAAILLAFWFAV